MPSASGSDRLRRGTLDDFLEPDDIVPLPRLADDQWKAVQQATTRALAWHFLTLRNIWAHGTGYARDSLGYAWGGIYRSLLVGSIVTTSYRNEGHVRAGDRIFGTGDFFRGGFVLPQSSPEFQELVRIVNLRHHVAGVVVPCGEGVRVLEGYEADYAYVATSFIESIRRGLAVCGLAPESPRGRAVGEQFCTLLYQLAGQTGLLRVPRDLAAHERFRDAFDRHLRARPSSSRVRRMAQEIARRIVPLTAAMADETVRGHVQRHLDEETAGYLFPNPPDEELEAQRITWRMRLQATTTEDSVAKRAAARAAIWQRPDVAALACAFTAASAAGTNERLIGAILLHALEAGHTDGAPIERRTVELDPDEPLIRQGEAIQEMFVVLSATEPLVVAQQNGGGDAPRTVATLAAPTVLGEIGMWRGQPATATVLARRPSRVELLVIDQKRFEALRAEPGFRVAVAAEVQRRLAIDAARVHRKVDAAVGATGDRRLVSITQLIRFLSGDAHGSLDAVIDLPDDATPAECLDALRKQVDDVIAAGDLDPELREQLLNVVATIG